MNGLKKLSVSGWGHQRGPGKAHYVSERGLWPKIWFVPVLLGIPITQRNEYPPGQWRASEAPRELFKTHGLSLSLEILIQQVYGILACMYSKSSPNGLGRFKWFSICHFLDIYFNLLKSIKSHHQNKSQSFRYYWSQSCLTKLKKKKYTPAQGRTTNKLSLKDGYFQGKKNWELLSITYSRTNF